MHGLLRWTRATPRPHGALRYRCPLTGAYVLVTDEPTLKRFSRPPARIRCADCGEQHLVTIEADERPIPPTFSCRRQGLASAAQARASA